MHRCRPNLQYCLVARDGLDDHASLPFCHRLELTYLFATCVAVGGVVHFRTSVTLTLTLTLTLT